MSLHSTVHAHQLKLPPCCPASHLSSPLRGLLGSLLTSRRRRSLDLTCQSDGGQEDYLLDAPVSPGDGFSFSGGKYSDGPSPADDWFKQGKMVELQKVGISYGLSSASLEPGVSSASTSLSLKTRVKAYAASGSVAKDPIFGLKMASSSQVSDDIFRWFFVESGSTDKPAVVLIHGLPSQAYSYRKVIPVLSKDYHVIAFDWLGFGFSEKPQPKYGFDYTMEEYVKSLGCLIDELGLDKVSLVVQGYFSPVVVKYASENMHRVNDLVLLNPPLTEKHAKLPSTLSIFSNFLLGEIFSQDPLRASDKTLTSCGPYKMKEEDAMVYRSPYLTSGSSGFALNAVSRSMKKQLKGYVDEMKKILMDSNWGIKTTVCWGQRDRWLSFEGVEEFCKESKHRLVQLPMAGHHVQEDSGAELGEVLAGLISKRRRM